LNKNSHKEGFVIEIILGARNTGAKRLLDLVPAIYFGGCTSKPGYLCGENHYDSVCFS
jgi:hypothetical protein